jgi:hypothetical protein
MLHVQCRGCLTSAYLDCHCELLGHDLAGVGAHAAGCPFADLGAQVVCPPGSPCCKQDHSHDATANACPQNHGTAPCPNPGRCETWEQQKRDVVNLDPDVHGQLKASLAHITGDCPGGHCGFGVPGCTVCRPVTVTVMPGSVHLKQAGA